MTLVACNSASKICINRPIGIHTLKQVELRTGITVAVLTLQVSPCDPWRPMDSGHCNSHHNRSWIGGKGSVRGVHGSR